MTITKVIKDLIEPNTYNEITSNIGNTQPVTINSIVFANTTFVNTSNISMLTTGGYFKLYGNNYQENANVYLDRYVASNTTYISNNELRVTFSTIPAGTYSLFLYNPNGSNAIRYNSIVVQGNNTLGYIVAGTGGGGLPTNYSSVERITFSNDTITADTRGSLSATRAAAFSLSTNQFGYVLSGRANSAIGSPPGSGTNFRINFNNDTTSATALPVVFSPGTFYGTSIQNSTYGYLAGGSVVTESPTSVSTIFRFDFSSDSTVQSSRGTLDTARGNFVSGENNNFGWFFGGYFGTVFNPGVGNPANTNAYSLTSRMDFSADTNNTIVRGPIGSNLFAGATTQNQNYSWVSGGMISHSYTNPSSPAPFYNSSSNGSVYRFDFSNDTTAGAFRASHGLLERLFQNTTHDNDYGWYTGGSSPVPNQSFPTPLSPSIAPGPMFFDNLPSNTTLSSVVRLTFSNDTALPSTRGALNQVRRNASGINGINT